MSICKQHTNSLLFHALQYKVMLFTGMILGLQACSSGSGGVSTERDTAAEASYKATFSANWTPARFPTNYPGGAHFTGLVGGTHNEQVVFWMPGDNASAGIENVAETGSQGKLTGEVNAAKTDGKAEFVLGTTGNIGAAASVTFEFDINEAYPLVTLVSMVAPSPDWFVGVHGVSLLDDATGEFKQTVVVELEVYDAGTENGQAFKLSNADTQPREPVKLLSRINPSDHDFVDGVGPDGGFIASITFERIK